MPRWTPDRGSWLLDSWLVAGFWLRDSGCWFLVAGCWLLASGCWQRLVFRDATMRPMRRAVPGLVVLAAAAVLCASGCRRAAPPARDPTQNVLLITIDTLRADALGSYGNASA